MPEIDPQLTTLETPPCEILTITQCLAREVVTAFLANGGRKALEKSCRGSTIARVITCGSCATVYRFSHNGVEYAIKEAQSPADRFVYCQSQLAGQAELVTKNYPHFVPYNHLPIDGRYLVQPHIEGVPCSNPNVIRQLIYLLNSYGLAINDPKVNAIISPQYCYPLLVDLGTIAAIA